MLIEKRDRFDKLLSTRLSKEAPGITTYFIATDDAKVFHYGAVDNKHQMETGQPKVRTYRDREQWVATLAGLGINPDEDQPADRGNTNG